MPSVHPGAPAGRGNFARMAVLRAHELAATIDAVVVKTTIGDPEPAPYVSYGAFHRNADDD
jgi:hypothetical protein